MQKPYVQQFLQATMKVALGYLLISILFAGMALAHDGHPQPVLNQRVNIRAENQAIRNILSSISRQADVRFVYNSRQIAADRRVSFQAMDEPLATVLERLLNPLSISYEPTGRQIVLTPKSTSSLNPSPTAGAEGTAVAFAITGKVTDENGGVLPGVNVVLKGTSTGTATNAQGIYSLGLTTQPAADATLLLSYIGYETLERAISNQTILNLSLTPKISSLSEVVVVGYGEQRTKDITGAISSVKGDQIRSLPVAGLDQAIQGRVSGVTITNNTGQPGGGVSVRIRGVTSLTGSNEPLYVVDGVPFDGQGMVGQKSQEFSAFGGGSGQSNQSMLASINPTDIVSIDILKDASATAIYGSRASNGVIIITTRRGKANESKISYDGYVGVQEPWKYLPVMNLREYAEYRNHLDVEQQQATQEEFRDISLLGEGTNWQREIFRQALVHSHQLSISGGKDKTQFYISGGYFKQDGIVIGSNFDRYSFRVNLDNQVKNWLKLGSSFTLSRTKQRITLTDDDNGVVSSALLQAPNVPVKYPDGSWGGPEVSTYSFQTNPVAQGLLKDVTRNQTRLLGTIFAEINLGKHLTLRNELGGDINFTQNSAFNPTYKWGSVVNTVNKLIRSDIQSYFWILKNYLTYHNTFATRHNVTALLGHEAQKSQYEYLSATRSNFLSNDVQAIGVGTANTATNDGGKGASTLESYFGRINYGFDDRYNLTLTLRADGSSRFGPENRWGYFPSAAAAWTINRERFLQGVKALSNLKLRVGYGTVGNQNIAAFAYGVALNPVITANGTGYYPDKVPNQRVKWESATQTNLGLDLGLLSDRIALTVDVYNKLSKDFLYQLPLPAFTGLGVNYDDIQSPYVNLGRMQNRGIDLALNTTNIAGKNLTWRSSLVFSHYKNKLLELADQNAVIFKVVQFNNVVTRTAVGQPVGQFYGYRVAGIFQTLDEINSSPKQSAKVDPGNGTYIGDLKFKDLNNDGVIDGQDREYIGNPNPKFTFGFSNTLTYKGFDLSVFLQGSYGSKILNFTRRDTEGMNQLNFNQLQAVTNRWRADMPTGQAGNTNTAMPRAVVGDPNENRRISDRFIEDGSYLRFQNISLAYTLPEALTKRVRLNHLKVYANVQNLYTFTRYTGFDPELGAYNQDALLVNVDNGHYPIPRNYTFGINLDF